MSTMEERLTIAFRKVENAGRCWTSKDTFSFAESEVRLALAPKEQNPELEESERWLREDYKSPSTVGVHRERLSAELDRLRASVKRLEAERDSLAAWKESAMAVDAEWEPLREFATRHGARLGHSMAKEACRLVSGLEAENAPLKVLVREMLDAVKGSAPAAPPQEPEEQDSLAAKSQCPSSDAELVARAATEYPSLAKVDFSAVECAAMVREIDRLRAEVALLKGLPPAAPPQEPSPELWDIDMAVRSWWHALQDDGSSPPLSVRALENLVDYLEKSRSRSIRTAPSAPPQEPEERRQSAALAQAVRVVRLWGELASPELYREALLDSGEWKEHWREFDDRVSSLGVAVLLTAQRMDKEGK